MTSSHLILNLEGLSSSFRLLLGGEEFWSLFLKKIITVHLIYVTVIILELRTCALISLFQATLIMCLLLKVAQKWYLHCCTIWCFN